MPEVPYSHVVLTMPDHFWPIFRANRHLLNDLPVLGAEVIQRWVRKKYGARLLLAVVPHTFGRDLKFNCHLHILVSQGGLSRDESTWLPSLPLWMDAIMKMWRYAVVTFLRIAYRRGLLSTKLDRRAFHKLMEGQYERSWHPSIRGTVRATSADCRTQDLGSWTWRSQVFDQDLKSRSTVETSYTLEAFIERLGHQVPDRYVNSIRYFGLLAPRTKGRLYEFIFHLLGQHQLKKPSRLPWAKALIKYFGVNPLVDAEGRLMHWVGRLDPVSPLN